MNRSNLRAVDAISVKLILRLPELVSGVQDFLGHDQFLENISRELAINPLSFGAKKRTKRAVVAAKGLYLDLDSDGDRRLAALRESNAVPPPTAVIHTSIGKYQVIWRVRGFTIPEQEAMLKGFAEAFGGDRACTDCARVFRLPGFFNRKYTPLFRSLQKCMPFSRNTHGAISGWNCQWLRRFNPAPLTSLDRLVRRADRSAIGDG